MNDFLIRGSLAALDASLDDLLPLEAERQVRKLILIPSESTAPLAVREAMASAFQTIYAEGYSDEETRWMGEADILDYPTRLAHFRRYSDPRRRPVRGSLVWQSPPRLVCLAHNAFATPPHASHRCDRFAASRATRAAHVFTQSSMSEGRR